MTPYNVLQSAGLKPTDARVAVLSLLMSTPGEHFTAEAISKHMTNQRCNIPMATLYRVLFHLEKTHLVTKHRFEPHQEAVFEYSRRTHHDHMVCVECGHIFEFENEAIEHLQQSIADRASFKLVGHALVLYGICQKCV
jgi:Fur family transcriptional regulator, ferric uptake regulator